MSARDETRARDRERDLPLVVGKKKKGGGGGE